MQKMSFKEKVLHKIYVSTEKIRAIKNKQGLLKDDFSIISNNCWGGMTSEAYGLRKNSPTVGCYFYAEDYLKFIKRLDYYTSMELKFIDVESSNHKEWIYEDGSENVPIGRLDDVDIIFLHYANKEDAKAKWARRCKRINWNNLIFKFSKQNHATLEDLKSFDKMDLWGGKKIMFVNTPIPELKSALYYPGYENEPYVRNDTFWGHRYFNVTHFINYGVIEPNKKTYIEMFFKTL